PAFGHPPAALLPGAGEEPERGSVRIDRIVSEDEGGCRDRHDRGRRLRSGPCAARHTGTRTAYVEARGGAFGPRPGLRAAGLPPLAFGCRGAVLTGLPVGAGRRGHACAVCDAGVIPTSRAEEPTAPLPGPRSRRRRVVAPAQHRACHALPTYSASGSNELAGQRPSDRPSRHIPCRGPPSRAIILWHDSTRHIIFAAI